MTKKWAIVTGAGTGIGRALSLHLTNVGVNVLAIGRRPEPIQSLQMERPQQIDFISADVSNPNDWPRIAEKAPAKIDFLIHNAAILEPIQQLATIDYDSWRKHMAINLDGPLFLTQHLLPKMSAGSRILHISSGAAHGAYHGWGAYCTSKAAFHMLYQLLDQELSQKGIRVGSVRPGVVDTPMQGVIRKSDPDVFPDRPRFIDLKQNNELSEPQDVARYLTWLLLQTNDNDFAAEEWDIRQTPRDLWA